VTLTPRELEVLALVATGSTAHASARRLGCAKRTVDKHLERVTVNRPPILAGEPT